MGLDIYLHRYDKSRAQVVKENKAWEKVSDKIFHKHFDPIKEKRGADSKMTDEEREAYKKELAEAGAKHGRIGEWQDNASNPQIEIDSAKYPEHMFKIGYFRSSYNGGGINHVLEERVGETLYSILGLDNDEYIQQPDWKKVIENCDRVIAEFREFLKENPFSVLKVMGNPFMDTAHMPKSEADALRIAKENLKTEQFADELLKNGFGNRNGEWFPQGMKIYGAMPGFEKFINSQTPVTYLVVKYNDDTGEEPFKWYINALEIVKETAEWVLNQENPEKYFLHVSG